MYERKIPVDTKCGIVVFMELMGGKWKPWLINHIHDGSTSPSSCSRAFLWQLNGCSLSNWGELEAAGFVYKRVYAEIPMRVEYFLTEIGESVYPIIQAMDQWGKSHRDLLEKK